jgi:hypothetical protein
VHGRVFDDFFTLQYDFDLLQNKKTPFYILTSNPQIIRGNIENWRITRVGYARCCFSATSTCFKIAHRARAVLDDVVCGVVGCEDLFEVAYSLYFGFTFWVW